MPSLVGSEMCIRDRFSTFRPFGKWFAILRFVTNGQHKLTTHSLLQHRIESPSFDAPLLCFGNSLHSLLKAVAISWLRNVAPVSGTTGVCYPHIWYYWLYMLLPYLVRVYAALEQTEKFCNPDLSIPALSINCKPAHLLQGEGQPGVKSRTVVHNGR